MRALQEIQPLGPAPEDGAQSCFLVSVYHHTGVSLPLWHFTLLHLALSDGPVPAPPTVNVNGVVPHWL